MRGGLKLDYRVEKDFLGECRIENDRYYGINTKRALENFKLKSKTVNLKLIREIALIKKAAAIVNKRLNRLPDDKALKL